VEPELTKQMLAGVFFGGEHSGCDNLSPSIKALLFSEILFMTVKNNPQRV
jgi:hypothetical protein